MATTVKLDNNDKRKLEQLQALVTLRAGGKKVTQQELLSALIRQALEKGDEFVKEVFKETVPMSDSDFEKVLSLANDWGVRTKWQEIDKVAYGVKKK